MSTEAFFRGLLEDQSLGLGGIERALALRGLEEAELESVGRKMLADGWSLATERRAALKQLVDGLAARRERSQRGLRARIARLQRMVFGVPVQK